MGCDKVNTQYAGTPLLGCDILQAAKDAAAATQDGFPLTTNFPKKEDVEYAYSLLKGYSTNFFPLVPYKKLLTKEEEIDEVHGEIIESQKRWGAILQVRAYVIPSQIQQPATGFGIEDVRNIEVLITIPDLESSGLIVLDHTTFDITLLGRLGDHLFYHRREYEIDTFYPIAFFVNTDIPLYFQIKAQLYRGESQNDFGLH